MKGPVGNPGSLFSTFIPPFPFHNAGENRGLGGKKGQSKDEANLNDCPKGKSESAALLNDKDHASLAVNEVSLGILFIFRGLFFFSFFFQIPGLQL